MSPATAREPGFSILIVEDERILREILTRHLGAAGHRCRAVEDGDVALVALRESAADIVIADIRMPRLDGLAMLKRMRADGLRSEVILMSAFVDVPKAVVAIRLGCCDIIEKPFSLWRLDEALDVARQRLAHRASQEAQVGPAAPGSGPPKTFLGWSPGMRAVTDLIARVGPTDSTLLIEGETGVGKEVVARAVHAASLRRDRRFVAVNCGALPESLVESELFGHETGAFTGATGSSVGLFRAADGGTLFLDEIGELPSPVQVKLLRAIEEREVQPVVSTEPRPVDVRIIAATHCDLAEAVRQGRFRQDLLFRLDVVRLAIPPLRERPIDIGILAEHFIERMNARFGRHVGGILPAALARLERHPFPGNVRELENIIERAFALGATEAIGDADLPSLLMEPDAEQSAPVAGSPGRLDQTKRMSIDRALEQAGGNVARAAEILGISSRTVRRHRGGV